MALVRGNRSEAEAGADQRRRARDLEGLLAQLRSPEAAERRWAARDLGEQPQAVAALGERLVEEADPSVREAILDSLLKIGGEAVVEVLLPLLHSEDAALRNGVIEVLQELPEAISPHMERLLHDPDSDVRIFAIDILQVLAHPEAPRWIAEVLEQEGHVNVLATAVDRAAEIGTREMVPALEALKARFPDQPYIAFAVDTAIRRIRGE